MQAVEIGNAVGAEQHGLTVEHKRIDPIAQGGLDDQRIVMGPVVAVPGEQPDPLAVALHDQPIAVMFDFVDPVRPGRHGRAAGRQAGGKCRFDHARRSLNCERVVIEAAQECLEASRRLAPFQLATPGAGRRRYRRKRPATSPPRC
jgi:hypothetical protein